MKLLPHQTYAAGVCVTNIGTWMQRLGAGWLAWELTHSAAWVGALTLGDLLSAALVTPFAGVFADRCNPYRFMRLAQLLLAAPSVALWLVTVSGGLNISGLFALTLALSFVQGFSMPVGASLVARLAGRERLAQAVAANALAMNLARALGPALAGVFLARGLTGWLFAANAVSYLLFLAFLRPLRPLLDVTPAHRPARLAAEFADGLRYVARTPHLAVPFALAFTSSLLVRPVVELFPAFVGQVFNGSGVTLSVIEFAFGAGGLTGGLAMLWLSQRRRNFWRLVYAVTLAHCLAAAWFSLCLPLPFTLPAALLLGGTGTLSFVGLQMLLQLNCAPSLRGRVLSLFQLTFRGAPPVGSLLLGLAAQHHHLRWLTVSATLLAALVVGGIKLRNSEPRMDTKPHE